MAMKRNGTFWMHDIPLCRNTCKREEQEEAFAEKAEWCHCGDITHNAGARSHKL